MEKKKLYTIIMAFLMLGSIVSFSFLFGGPNQGNAPPEGAVPPPGTTPPTAIKFEASSVSATVEQLFPTISLTASTAETEITKIDSQVKKISGVKKINNSYYREQSGTGLSGPLVYVAEASINPNASREEIAKAAKNLSVFTDSAIIVVGLVKLPDKITFTNPDLNVSQEQALSPPTSQAYLNLGTMQGDLVRVQLQASIASTTLQNLLAFELQNLTASPKFFMASGEYEISSLQNILSFNASANFSNKGTVDLLAGKLKGVSGVVDANVNVNSGDLGNGPLTINFDQNAILFEQDLNTFFSGFGGVKKFSIDMNKRSATVSFDQNVEFLQFVSGMNSQLDSLHFTVEEIIEPKIAVQGTVEISGDSSAIEGEIKLLLEKSGLSEAIFNQSAKMTAGLITDSSSNESFPVDGNSFDASVKTGHAVGDKAPLSMFVIASRGKIETISAQETEPQKDQNVPKQ